MSRWASNTTWLRLQGAKTAQKGAKKACHVALDLQRDVAPPQKRQNYPKRSKKSAPRRIGPPPCRVGPPTRRGSASKAAKQPKKEQKERAMSYWDPAMTRWASNATSHTPNTTWLSLFLSFSLKMPASLSSHVVLDLQRDMAHFQHDVAPPLYTKNHPRYTGGCLSSLS